MKRTALFALTFAALSLLLLALTFAPTRGASPVAWMPWRGTWSEVPGATYGPGSLYLPSPTATPIAPSPTPARTPRRATSAPTPTRTPRTYFGPSVAGISTWYVYHQGQAAAAKTLRDFLGAGWRGEVVLVCHDGLCLRIRLTDYESSLIPGRLIDLDSSDFRRICGPLSIGICSVEVSQP